MAINVNGQGTNLFCSNSGKLADLKQNE